MRQARRIANEDADLLDLLFGELEREKFDSCFFAIGWSANDTNKFVQIRECDEITLESLRPFFGLAQFEPSPTQDDVAPMFDVSRVRILEWK